MSAPACAPPGPPPRAAPRRCRPPRAAPRGRRPPRAAPRRRRRAAPTAPTAPILSPPPPGGGPAAVAENPPSPPDKDEEYMAEAMSRLSQALRNSDNPDEETSRQVREIQDQISRMLEEERLLSDDEDDDSSVTSSQY